MVLHLVGHKYDKNVRDQNILVAFISRQSKKQRRVNDKLEKVRCEKNKGV